MQTLETIKTKSQETLNNLLEKGKERPEEVKAWGITAGGAVVGALTVTAAAKGVVAIFAAIAAPPIALTLGAVGGGVLGWNFMQKQDAAGSDTSSTDTSSAEASAVVPAAASTAVVAEPTIVPTPEPTVVPTASAAVAKPVAEMVNDQADEVVTPVTEVPIAEATTVAAESTTTATVDEAPVDTTEALVPEPAAAMVSESSTDPVVESPAESMSETMTPDNLEAINGIGPVYAGRLHTAGVKTFAQLAELTPDRIQEIIGPIRSGHMIEAEKWIAEARKFAGQGIV